MSETVSKENAEQKNVVVSSAKTVDDTIIADATVVKDGDVAEKNKEAATNNQEKVDEQKKEEVVEQKQEDAKYGDLPPELHRFQDSYAKNGKLTESDYADLQKMGLPKNVVDDHIKMRQELMQLKGESRAAKQAADDKAILDTIGGIEEFESVKGWAAKKLSDEEKTAFNSLMNGSDIAAKKLAMSGLHARFRSENPKEPKLMGGQRAITSSVEPFETQKDFLNAVKNPRYKTEPSYRNQVERRLAVSKF